MPAAGAPRQATHGLRRLVERAPGRDHLRAAPRQHARTLESEAGGGASDEVRRAGKIEARRDLGRGRVGAERPERHAHRWPLDRGAADRRQQRTGPAQQRTTAGHRSDESG